MLHIILLYWMGKSISWDQRYPILFCFSLIPVGISFYLSSFPPFFLHILLLFSPLIPHFPVAILFSRPPSVCVCVCVCVSYRHCVLHLPLPEVLIYRVDPKRVNGFGTTEELRQQYSGVNNFKKSLNPLISNGTAIEVKPIAEKKNN